jgi:hypothetical protein
MIQACVDLLVGRAFVPDSQDITVPLARRFAKRPLIAVLLYKDGLEAVPLSFANGEPVLGTPEFVATGGEDVDSAFLRSFAERHKAQDCLFILTTGYTAVLSSRTRRPENDAEAIQLMRDNPERLLGEPAAAGCRPSIVYHPTHNYAIVFNERESEINGAVSLASKTGLNVARLQCGMTSVLMQLFATHWADFGKEAEVLMVDRGSLLYLSTSETTLGRPLFDVGVKEAALKQAVAERVAKLKAGGTVVLVDLSGLGVEAMIAARGEKINVVNPLKDQPQPALWACAGDTPHLGYDLFPNERIVRPFAPGRLRAVPVVFWGAAAASVAIIGINLYRSATANTLTADVKRQEVALTAAQKKAEEAVHTAEVRAKTARAIGDWLEISPHTQDLLIRNTREIEAATAEGTKENRPVAQVDSISIACQEGQPQLRLAIVALGDASAANRVFQRISALFGKLGYGTVDLKETIVPQGYRYEHLLNMPVSPQS